MRAGLLVAIFASLGLPTAGECGEIKLLASAAMKSAYLELLPQFEKETGHKLSAGWSSSPDIQKRVAGGEIADVVVLSDMGTEELVKLRKLLPETRTTFAKSGIAVAVRAGAQKPDISSVDTLKATLRAAKSVAYSSGASGSYVVTMIQKLGLAAEVKPKVVNVKTAEPVGEVVARGDADIGFHQLSELIPVKGIEIVGPLPPELQHLTVFSGGAHSEAGDPDAARALVKFLAAPAVVEVLKKHGLEPG
jgi:molybdate transport system substrate-binding protein